MNDGMNGLRTIIIYPSALISLVYWNHDIQIRLMSKMFGIM